MVDKDKIKYRVLTENTAQGVLNHLRELEANRARMQKRWIWELLQNARDAAADKDTHLVASVELGDGELVFQHNGRGFTIEEVAHLIYHGSTKIEDENTIGQYGSGFLTTHLLSSEIDVSGQLDDERAFNFRLKREIASAKALSASMDRAWDDFDASTEAGVNSFTTRFRYPVVADDAAGAVEEGIKTLKQCAPFVVVFNRQFRSIEIKSLEETIIFEVVEREPLSAELQAVTVRVSENDSLEERKYVLAEGQRASVTIPMAPKDNEVICLPLDRIPRLFLGFPLVGTETFSFPAVINSFEFTPTEKRDGVYLGQNDDEVNNTNQAIVIEACDLQVKLTAFVTESRWTNTYTLATIPAISEQPWLNRDWIHSQLGKLVSQVRQIPAVVSSDSQLSPTESIIPLAREADRTETLWDLLSGVKVFQKKLPMRDEADGWRDAVESWSVITAVDAKSFDEGYDGNKLVTFLEAETKDGANSYGTLKKLEDVLQDDIDAVRWVDRLHEYLQSDGFDSLMREGHIVLDQAGYLDKLSNLFRDKDIRDLAKINWSFSHCLGVSR